LMNRSFSTSIFPLSLHDALPILIYWKTIKGVLKLNTLHLSTLLSACKFGCCVVAHQPNAPIFLRLGRGLFYADVSVLLDTFSHKDRKSTRLNSSHVSISYAVFCW